MRLDHELFRDPETDILKYHEYMNQCRLFSKKEYCLIRANIRQVYNMLRENIAFNIF